MKALFTIALSLYATAVLMIEHAVDFQRWAMNENKGVLFNAAINNISPSISMITGMNLVPPLEFFLLCASAGTLIGFIGIYVIPGFLSEVLPKVGRELDAHLFDNFFKALTEHLVERLQQLTAICRSCAQDK